MKTTKFEIPTVVVRSIHVSDGMKLLIAGIVAGDIGMPDVYKALMRDFGISMSEAKNLVQQIIDLKS